MQNIKAIILVGARDFGRCPLASCLPTALWPIAGRPALERLLCHLADQGIRRAVVCSNGEGALLAESICADSRLELEFFNESLPVGTAGCIRNAVNGAADELLMVLPANIACPPELSVLIDEHRRAEADLTVMLNPSGGSGALSGQAAGIYICSSDILEHIPEAGYSDIKEGVIPAMLRAKKTIHAVELPNDVGNFPDRQAYLKAVACYIENIENSGLDVGPLEKGQSADVWVAPSARIDSQARIYGPAVIMDGATVSSGAVVIGPAVIEEAVVVSEASLISNTVLWRGASIGQDCQIERSVIDRDVAVRGGSVVRAKAVALRSGAGIRLIASSGGSFPFATSRSLLGGVKRLAVEKAVPSRLRPRVEEVVNGLAGWTSHNRRNVLIFFASVFVSIAFIWSYQSGLSDLWNLWRRSDEYSSGILVPFLAAYVLWARRNDIALCTVKPSAWGLVAFAGAQLVRFLGLFLMYNSAERLSIVLSIAALVLLLFGWQIFRKISPVLLFLCLMLPLPNVIQYSLGLHLQRYATESAVFCLEVIGYEIAREGNVITIGNATVAVAEACNGLRMITAFLVISGLVVLLVQRKWWEKVIILLSSLPIALLCNTVRLTITAVFFTVLEGEYWEDVFHDFGGYAMMPLALAATVGELWLLAKLTTLPVEDKAVIIRRQSG